MNDTFSIPAGAVERWTHRGLDCVMRPSPLGPLNGYVRLPKEHPLFGEHYDRIEVDVHGGLTYGCDEDGWVGFDTGHYGDYWDVSQLELTDEGRYLARFVAARALGFARWTKDRLRREVEHLAEQLAEEHRQAGRG